MIQDIFPSKLKNEYKNVKMKKEDCLLIFDQEGRILLGEEGDEIMFPLGKMGEKLRTVYLFSIDEKRYFLCLEKLEPELKGFAFYGIRDVRDRFRGKEVYAVFTAYHLWRWYADNVFCGRCGTSLEIDDKERALRCPKCGNVIYPRINPAVIVGVIKGDCLLITRYRRGFAQNALVAGFVEIGETLEECVAREVMEETGIKVKNVRYYKSQPWGMAQDVLVGFFCEADGDEEIRMDETELKYAEWVRRSEIVLQSNNASLTNEMMSVFKRGEEPG